MGQDSVILDDKVYYKKDNHLHYGCYIRYGLIQPVIIKTIQVTELKSF